jgi:uncharacterized protein YndB with AHSA1/START domain
MASDRRGSAVVEYPSDLEIRITRAFDAPIALVFEVMTKPEHLLKTLAPYGEEVTRCEVDLRVGGDYNFSFRADDGSGSPMSFRGTFLEVERPRRTVQTWLYDGWPDADAVESMDLDEVDGVTTMTYRLVFTDKVSRDRMSAIDGLESNFDNVDDLLSTLVQAGGAEADQA